MFIQVLTKEYKEMNAEPGPDLPVYFEEDMITLKIPKETVQNGWSICPLSYPGVRGERIIKYRCSCIKEYKYVFGSYRSVRTKLITSSAGDTSLLVNWKSCGPRQTKCQRGS